MWSLHWSPSPSRSWSYLSLWPNPSTVPRSIKTQHTRTHSYAQTHPIHRGYSVTLMWFPSVNLNVLHPKMQKVSKALFKDIFRTTHTSKAALVGKGGLLLCHCSGLSYHQSAAVGLKLLLNCSILFMLERWREAVQIICICNIPATTHPPQHSTLSGSFYTLVMHTVGNIRSH